jgi:aspartate/methionine/tyrosine aminotransferase
MDDLVGEGRDAARSFPTFRYMRWAKSHTPVRPGEGVSYYLAASGLAPPSEAELPLATCLPELDQRGFDMPPEAHRRLSARYGVDGDRLMLSLGTSHAMYLLCATGLRPGDRCLVERPAYEMLANLPRLFGAEVERFERRFEDGWGLPPDLPERIRARRPKMILLSNPHNPTGALLRRELLVPVVEAAREVGALVAVDEVYLEYTADPVGASALDLGEEVAIASSFTKAYGLGTVRFGWLVGSAARIGAALRYNDYISVLHPNPSSAVGVVALKHLEMLSARARRIQSRGRAIVDAWVHSRRDVSWRGEGAGVIGLLRLHPVSDSMAFVERLEREHDTLVVPGAFFEAEGFVRLGFGAEPEILREGLARLGRALDAV